MNISDTLVGVVIPMFNAARTIDETLDSVLAQTHRCMDIVVVDDGSTDLSVDFVKRRAETDPRVRLIQQSNKGVAAARNVGAAHVKGDYLAFIDSDDLWSKDKTELQLKALLDAGPTVGVAYCWFALLDDFSFVIELGHQPTEAGDVLKQLCNSNFVGNGSSLLVTRNVFDSIGGFDTSLRKDNAQGCEDLLFCLEAAEKTHFCLVPRPLVGYRRTNENMSSDVMQMWRSAQIVIDRFKLRHPTMECQLREHLGSTARYLILRALKAKRILDARALQRHLIETDLKLSPSLARHYVRVYLRALCIPTILKRTVRRRTATSYLSRQW